MRRLIYIYTLPTLKKPLALIFFFFSKLIYVGIFRVGYRIGHLNSKSESECIIYILILKKLLGHNNQITCGGC